MTAYRQLTIWDILDEISDSPATSSLAAVWDCLDTELKDLPVEAQLATAAVAFSQIADILKTRAQLLLEDVRAQTDTDGPVISTDIFAGLVRTTMQLDLDDLIEDPPQQTFRPHGPHQFIHPSGSGDSLAAPVEKENVLAMLEIQTVEDVHRLAGDEDVDKWRGAIAQYGSRPRYVQNGTRCKFMCATRRRTRDWNPQKVPRLVSIACTRPKGLHE